MFGSRAALVLLLARSSAALVAPPSVGGVTVLKRISVAGGTLTRFSHESSEARAPMTASIFIPSGLEYAARSRRSTGFPG